jgi:hypothetical protein
MNHCDLLALRCERPAASQAKSFAVRGTARQLHANIGRSTAFVYPLAIRLLTLVPMLQFRVVLAFGRRHDARGFDDLRQLPGSESPRQCHHANQA